jgi:hypothetical protein
MNYTSLVLFMAALVGVLLHNLKKIDEINRNPNLNGFNFTAYIKKEWASVAMSILISGVAAYFQTEIKELHDAGKWLGLGFVAIGYLSQSLLITYIGKAEKLVNKD